MPVCLVLSEPKKSIFADERNSENFVAKSGPDLVDGRCAYLPLFTQKDPPMSDRIAFITGITGQDGSYLAELLLSKGYEVHGLIRRASSFNTGRIDHVYQDPHHKGQKLHLHYGDLTDAGNLQNLLTRIKPNEVYNLGAQSHVRVSFDMPVYTVDTVAMGPVKLLEAIRVYQDESGDQIRSYLGIFI